MINPESQKIIEALPGQIGSVIELLNSPKNHDLRDRFAAITDDILDLSRADRTRLEAIVKNCDAFHTEFSFWETLWGTWRRIKVPTGEFKNCIRCGLPESDPVHNRQNPPSGGWHPFRDQDYLDGLEDALLFAREKNQPHQWVRNGITIVTAEPFDEKYCSVCGAVNWGGKEDGVCFGNRQAEIGIIAAHNRRAIGIIGEAENWSHSTK